MKYDMLSIDGSREELKGTKAANHAVVQKAFVMCSVCTEFSVLCSLRPTKWRDPTHNGISDVRGIYCYV